MTPASTIRPFQSYLRFLALSVSLFLVLLFPTHTIPAPPRRGSGGALDGKAFCIGFSTDSNSGDKPDQQRVGDAFAYLGVAEGKSEHNGGGNGSTDRASDVANHIVGKDATGPRDAPARCCVWPLQSCQRPWHGKDPLPRCCGSAHDIEGNPQQHNKKAV